MDQGASPEQVTALVTILSGQAGGMPWEAIAATIEKFDGPILRPIEMDADGQRGHVRIAGAVELETTPIRNPLAGDQEIEVPMVYPKGGILWNDGNIVTTSTMRVTHDSLRLEWPGKFGVVADQRRLKEAVTNDRLREVIDAQLGPVAERRSRPLAARCLSVQRNPESKLGNVEFLQERGSRGIA